MQLFRRGAEALRIASLGIGLGGLALGSVAYAAGGATPAASVSPSVGGPEAGRSGGAPASPRTIDVNQVRAGMTGYGLTVFQGTRPERFAVRVIDVLHNFLPKQDLILIQSDDPRLVHSGVVAGMSGSPIFLHTPDGDRLAGALAYGWQFSKDPVAGVTPIASMLAELGRPLRGPEHTPVAEAKNDVRPMGDAPMGQLVPVAVPLSIAGVTPAVFRSLSSWLSGYGITPLAAGGGAPEVPTGPAHFEPGSAIAVQLIRGDISIAGTGTVTWVDGDNVLAFGHPMFNLGELYLPVATAEVHTVLSSLSSSFKIASPLREVGSLVQDRQAGIVVDTAQRTGMIPVRVVVRSPRQATERVFHAEVIRHRFLTPTLAATVVANAAQNAASDVADATISVKTELGVRGYRPLELVDHAFSTDGFSPRALATMSGVKTIGELLFNPFGPANLDRIDVEVDVDYRADVAEIVGVALDSDTLEPGTRPSLRVTLRPYNGAEYVRAVPLDIPASLAGSQVKIEVAAGNLVKPDEAPPQDFGHLMESLRRGYPANVIVVSVQRPDEALALHGQVVSDLPPSVFDTLRPAASTRRGDTFKESARIVVPTDGVVIVGKQSLQARVKELSIQ